MTDNRDILLLLGELKGKMDAVLAHQIGMNQRLDAHDSRLNKLESAKAWVLGAGAAISTAGVAISTGMAFFIKSLNH